MKRLLLLVLLSFSSIILAFPSHWGLANAKDLKIAMILWRGETEAEKGFQQGLKEFGYSVQYTVMNAGQDRTELGRLLREELSPKLNNFDYIYVFGTTVASATKSIVQDKVPQIFNIVADPVGAGLVQSAESSGGNIAGVTNEIPLSLQLQTALKIVPFKRLGLLFNPREKNSMLVRDKLSEVARRSRFEIVDLRSPPAQEMLQENLQKLRDKSIAVDAVYLPTDSFLVSNAQLIGSELRAAKIKSIASIDTFIEKGALMGVVPDFHELGKAAAMIVHRHQQGTKLKDMPVQAAKKPHLMINKTTSKALNIKMPDALLKQAVIVE
jgi:putative tryptophan/tyrosine transport system substrate-binding protein